MLKIKKAVALTLALIMTLSCMPVSLAENGRNQVTDTIQNKDVVLIPREPEPEKEPEKEPGEKERAELSSEDISVSQLSEERLEALKDLIAGRDGAPKLRGGAKLRMAAQPVTNTYTGFVAFDISPKEETEAEQYDVTVQLSRPVALLAEEDAVIDQQTYELYHIHADEKNNIQVETITVQDGLAVECENGRITGFSFTTSEIYGGVPF